MELEELKKSWNALDEHLKDKELIKGGRTWQTDRTCRQRYPCHCPAEYQTHPDFFAGIDLVFLLEVLLHGRLNPIYIIIILSWIPHSTGDITTTCFHNRRKWMKCL